MDRKERRSYGPKINLRPMDSSISVVELIDWTFLSYDAARLREAAQLFSCEILEPDMTIGLSLTGVTPSEGVTWGKVDLDALADTVVWCTGATVVLPLITAYAMVTHAPRPPKRLYDRREELLAASAGEYRKKESYS